MAVFMTDFFFFWETNTHTNTILCSLVIVPSSLILLSSNSAKLLSSRMVICTIFLVFILPALPRDYVPTNLNMLMIYLPNTICLPPTQQICHQVCQFVSSSPDVYLVVVKRILRYINGTPNFRVFLQSGPFTLLTFLILTRLEILMIIVLPLASWCILAIVPLPRVPRNNQLFLDLSQNLNIVPLPLLPLSCVGFVKFWRIWGFFFLLLLNSGAKMS